MRYVSISGDPAFIRQSVVPSHAQQAESARIAGIISAIVEQQAVLLSVYRASISAGLDEPRAGAVSRRRAHRLSASSRRQAVTLRSSRREHLAGSWDLA